MTAAILTELETKYTEELRLFKEYYDVDKAAKAKIQQYIPENFYRTLKNKITGFSQVRTLSILTHLCTMYGSPKEEDVQDFDKNLKTSISANTCFEDFVAQIKDNTDAVSTQNPYSPAQIVSIAYTIVNATGFYSLDCKILRHKPAIDRTWANFKTFFADVFNDARGDGLTAHPSTIVGRVNHVGNATRDGYRSCKSRNSHHFILDGVHHPDDYQRRPC